MERKYEMVVNHIGKLVEDNRLKQGERLPSIRVLADMFKCNKSTIIKAYEILEMNHKIYSIPKSGYYLVERKDFKEGYTAEIDFAEVLPDAKLLPYREFNHCINKAIEQYKGELFSYGDTQGLESLRKVLVKHFSEYQVFASYEDIVITSGSQQALSILTKMPFPNGKKDILVEQPTYSLIHKLVELNGDRIIGIKRDCDGINLEELERIFKNEKIKFFYTIPRFHNPLGTSYSEREKKRIVELAEKYDVYIVEDDYLVDIETNTKALPAYYYDQAQRVIYVKSFSKTFMPGIRIGAVVIHKKLKEEFLKLKRCYDLNTSVLAQGALEIFINSGMYKRHIKKTQLQYKRKMDCVRECLNYTNKDIMDVQIPATGFFVWVKVPDRVPLGLLADRLKKMNIIISLAKEYYIDNKPGENSLRLCISRLSMENIRTGLRILEEEIKKVT